MPTARIALIRKAASLPKGSPERRHLLNHLSRSKRAWSKAIVPQALRSSFKDILIYALSEALQDQGVPVDSDDGGMIALSDGTVVSVEPASKLRISVEKYDSDTGENNEVFSQAFPYHMSPVVLAKRLAKNL